MKASWFSAYSAASFYFLLTPTLLLCIGITTGCGSNEPLRRSSAEIPR
jgi:hypothetical protein